MGNSKVCIMIIGEVPRTFMDCQEGAEAVFGLQFEAEKVNDPRFGKGFQIEGVHLRGEMNKFRNSSYEKLRKPSTNPDWRRFVDQPNYFIPEDCCKVVSRETVGKLIAC